MKVYLKSIAYIFIIILGATLILTILHYFNILNNNIVNITKLIITIGALVVGGYKVGNKAEKRGWLEGIKLSMIVIILFLVLSWIFNLDISLKNLIYYLIIIISGTAGSMVGISRKEKEEE